jgi:hypothetical protein
MSDDEKKESTNPADDQDIKEVEGGDEEGQGSPGTSKPADDEIIIK